MWARVIEFMLAIWLAISPFIFQYPLDETIFLVYGSISAFFVALFALTSFLHPLRKIHLLTLGVGLWLWGLSYHNFPETSVPFLENFAVIGVLLLMLAIVPSHSERLSCSWQKFVEKKLNE